MYDEESHFANDGFTGFSEKEVRLGKQNKISIEL